MDITITVITNRKDDRIPTRHEIDARVDVNTTILQLKRLVEEALKIPIHYQEFSLDNIDLNEDDYVLVKLLSSPSATRELIVNSDYNGDKVITIRIIDQSRVIDVIYEDINNDTYVNDLYEYRTDNDKYYLVKGNDRIELHNYKLTYYGVQEGDAIEIHLDDYRRPDQSIIGQILPIPVHIIGGELGNGRVSYNVNLDKPLQLLHDDIYRDYLGDAPNGEVIIFANQNAVDLTKSSRDIGLPNLIATVRKIKDNNINVKVFVVIEGQEEYYYYTINPDRPLQDLYNMILNQYGDYMTDDDRIIITIDGNLASLDRSYNSYDGDRVITATIESSHHPESWKRVI